MVMVQVVQDWLKQSSMRQSSLYRTIVYPLAVELRYVHQRYLHAKSWPVIVTDLTALAAERNWSLQHRQPLSIQQRDISRTIAEDARDIINNGRKRLRTHGPARSVWPRMRFPRAEMYYSHLYAVTRYPIQETFTCEVPDATILNPSGMVITARGEVLAQAAFQGTITKPLLLRIQNLPKSTTMYQGRYIPLLGPGVSGYAHWLFDTLPKLDLVDRHDPELKWLVPAVLPAYQQSALRLLGIAEERWSPVQEESLRVESCLLCHAAQRTGVPNAVHLRNVCRALVQAVVGDQAEPNPWRRLYISRAKSRRPVVNEQSLLPILHDHGFEIIYGEELSLEEQIRLFTEAKVVLGPHGAGMHNIIFSPPGAVVIEFFNPHRWDHTVCRIASLAGHQHWHIFGENAGTDWQTWVDPTKLKKIMEYALTDVANGEYEQREQYY